MASRTTLLLLGSMIRVATMVGVLLAPRLAAAEDVDFSRDILPILSANCFECHGPDGEVRQADLRLDRRDDALAERADAPAIVPGRPEDSGLIARVTSADPDVRMPPADAGPALSTVQVQLLRDWIAQGGEYTEHWSFIRPVRPPLPDVQRGDWSRSPIDRFILRRLEQNNLQPAPAADRATLIRRATFDLIGLPPTPAEVANFLADQSPDAYEKLIARLLASPQYGERWARHWLDVARYADSGGFETDIFFGHAWRYRDYVIRSLNADKPFDRFIKEQIAGDELYPGDAEARVATGLYTIGPVLQEAGMVEGKLEYDLLTDAADTTGSAFLSLTLACARCHDHKYDPISQRDYYGMQAIFAASDQHDFDEAGNNLRSGVALRKTMDQFTLEQAKLHARRSRTPGDRDAYLRQVGDYYIEQDRDLSQRLDESEGYADYEQARRRYRQALEKAESAPAADADSMAQLDELLREVGQQALNLAGQDRRARRALRRMSRDERNEYLLDYGRKNLDLAIPEGLIGNADDFRIEVGRQHLNDPSEIPVRALAHRKSPLEVRLLGRGELSNPGDVVPPGFPAKLASGVTPGELPPDKWRSTLVEWVASDANPLTARVIVNRVWQWHFGQGLVRTPNDFGTRGEPPTHPELLDWLAVDFVEHGWSLKHLHRTIMLSSTYRMSSTADADSVARDPENRLLAHYQPHRVEAEAIWDSLRAVSGTLNMEMYGLPVAPPLDEQEQIGNYRDWPTSKGVEANRRGIYLLTRRSFRFPMLSSFDLPDNASSCGRRDITTVPNQCLALLNNRTMQEQASAFAARLLREADGNLANAASLAWKYAYGREIAPDEQSRVLAFLADRTGEPAGDAADATQKAVTDLCLAIFNTNEFVVIQ